MATYTLHQGNNLEVLKQMVTDGGQEEEVTEPVVVEVPDGDSHGVALAFQPCLLGAVREGHVAIVAKEAVLIFRVGLLQAGNDGAVGE